MPCRWFFVFQQEGAPRSANLPPSFLAAVREPPLFIFPSGKKALLLG
jgi:hypothetical protein